MPFGGNAQNIYTEFHIKSNLLNREYFSAIFVSKLILKSITVLLIEIKKRGPRKDEIEALHPIGTLGLNEREVK